MRYTVDDDLFLSGAILFESSSGVTDIEPPKASNGKKARWDGGGWVLERDFRGQMWFNSDTRKYEVSDKYDDARSAPWVPVLAGRIDDGSDRPSEYHTFNYATKQWEPDPALAESQAKATRNRLLSASDWTQLPDVPIATKEAWATYRQALRDITAQAGYPFNISWPQAPQ